MDNLTHSLVGALLGQAGLKRKTGLGMPALVIGANLPDVDAACFFWIEGAEHLGFRRGITHGPIAWVLLPLVLAGLLWAWDRWQAGRGKRPRDRQPVRFGWLYTISLLTCLTHPALDWLNVYGIRLLEPFSPRWFYGDTLFIIDVWLWALLGGATWWSARAEKRGRAWRKPAIAALMIALAYIGMNWAISRSYAAAFGLANMDTRASQQVSYRTLIASPSPLVFWRRELILGDFNAWKVVPADAPLDPTSARYAGEIRCEFPDEQHLQGSQVSAFMLWSRTPFAERAGNGSVILRDARFYDPRARDRFSVALPDVPCEELAAR